VLNSKNNQRRGQAIYGGMQAKPRNSVVVYAAQAGHKADDGLFTPILAEALSAPGRTLAAVLTDVRRSVHDRSGRSQMPGEYN
jgi:hypothetical protein